MLRTAVLERPESSLWGSDFSSPHDVVLLAVAVLLLLLPSLLRVLPLSLLLS
jgi:hypothetical protein